ncbi:unnamed protein product [Euphydryas editha]|uniref:AMP-dependent synthetase/ligase domain-containing protein n=1 Tax=Euphydryas editha TaxID=104508 RepID=A0AAU9U3Q7_EUPED|nr:unnamed protein product [Euphydryas editha]
MAQWRTRTDAVHWYMQELSSRVVAKSGIPSDIHHLGKLTLQGFKDAPDFVLQIDGATGESETFSSALTRSVQCATAFRKLGLKHGDVIVLMAPNHIHLTIPMYAAFYLGIAVAGIDMTFRKDEILETLRLNVPKIVFCQSERVKDVRSALQELQFDTQVFTFDKSNDSLSFGELLDKYGSDVSINDFKPAEFDPAHTTSLLIATSGTTGLPKSVAVTHKNIAVSVPYMWTTFKNFPTPTRLSIVFSPIQWYSALFQFVFSSIIRQTRLQSSAPMTRDHAYYLINKYRPTFTFTSPNMIATFLKIGDRDKCDFTSFETVLIGGSAVHPRLLEDMKVVSPNTQAIIIYGMSELSGIAFTFEETEPTSLGKPLQSMEHKLVNPETLKDITEPNVPGELWVKGPGIFKASGRVTQERRMLLNLFAIRMTHLAPNSTDTVDLTNYRPSVLSFSVCSESLVILT